LTKRLFIISNLNFSPALPALPVSFSTPNSANNSNFEYEWAPLSFFWLARCFNLSGNEKNKKEIMPRVLHLARLYEFPDDMFEKIIEFGNRKDIDWCPRVPEITGVRALQRQLNLTEAEYRLLSFAFLCSNTRLLGTLIDFLGNTFCEDSQTDIISGLIGIDCNTFKNMTDDKSTIVQMHLSGPPPLNFFSSPVERFSMRPEISKRILTCTSLEDDIIVDLLVTASTAKLTIDDYSHLGSQLELLKTCIKNATASKGQAMSILLVGMPGSGKTELAKALSKYADALLYEVPVIDNDRPNENNIAFRLGEFLRITNMLEGSPSKHILFDEVEDVLNQHENQDKRKGWINQILEDRKATTFWICNTTENFDDSFLRRFDYVLKMPALDYPSRVKMMHNAFSSKGISDQRIKALAAQRIETPSIIERVKKLTDRTAGGSLSVEKILELSFPNTPLWYSEELGNFEIDYCQADGFIELDKLTKHYQKNQNVRTLLTGMSGSGKSSLARFFCFECSQSTRYYEAMDLIDQNPSLFQLKIETAFYSNSDKCEMLVIDEIDQVLDAAMRIMPNPDLFNRWLIGLIRDFRQPLVMTLSNEKKIKELPTLADAFDGIVKLKPWSANLLSILSERFADANELKSPVINSNCSATPQQLILSLRNYRLTGNLNQVSTLRANRSTNNIGFLASVS
jgi:DNA replication protein DnaC